MTSAFCVLKLHPQDSEDISKIEVQTMLHCHEPNDGKDLKKTCSTVHKIIYIFIFITKEGKTDRREGKGRRSIPCRTKNFAQDDLKKYFWKKIHFGRVVV